MTDRKALEKLWERADGTYFRRFPDRFYHIRNAYQHECSGEFWTLGAHETNRRRIILCRADAEQKPLPDNKVMKIPFLAFADEAIEDDDDTLYPIVRDIMLDALKREKLK
jgi:hypothetical protein